MFLWRMANPSSVFPIARGLFGSTAQVDTSTEIEAFARLVRRSLKGNESYEGDLKSGVN
jgi:hypothetical protein